MPRNKYPEETVKKILDVSLKLFLGKGFEQTTVLDIVDNLGGLTRGAFYHHFKTKDEVVEAIFKRYFDESDPFEIAKQAVVSNGLERLKLALKLGLEANIENAYRIAMTDIALSLLSNPRFLAEHIKEVQKDAMRMADIVKEGMADGSLSQGNPKVISELFLLLVNVWMMPTIFPCDREETLAKLDILEKIFTGLGYRFLDNELGELFLKVLDTHDS